MQGRLRRRYICAACAHGRSYSLAVSAPRRERDLAFVGHQSTSTTRRSPPSISTLAFH
jgi:hypothetical protein